MPAFPLVTDADLKRARTDRAYRQRLAVVTLQHLIDTLARMRAQPEDANAQLAEQLREGTELAVKLSDLVKRLSAEAAEAEARTAS